MKKIELKHIKEIISFLNDHFNHFGFFPLDIEIDGITYDLGPTIEAIQNIEQARS